MKGVARCATNFHARGEERFLDGSSTIFLGQLAPSDDWFSALIP